MNNLNKGIISIAIVAVLVNTIIGVSYSYFTSNLSGEEVANTLLTDEGKMIITFANNDNKVELNSIKSSNNAVLIKKFAIDGTNTNTSVMKYSIYLNVENNNFSNNSLTCSLVGRSLKKEQDLINVNNLYIPSKGELNLGTGSFKNAENYIHEYELNIYYFNRANNKDKNNFLGKIIVKDAER